jgi:hypothetical protein
MNELRQKEEVDYEHTNTKDRAKNANVKAKTGQATQWQRDSRAITQSLLRGGNLQHRQPRKELVWMK